MDDPQEKKLDINVFDSVRLEERFGLQGCGPTGEVQGVRLVDGQTQSMSVDTRHDGTVWVQTEGTAISGSDKADEVRVCQILVDRFNNDGGQWEDARPNPRNIDNKSRYEDGVDVIAQHRHDGTIKLRQFQVTRIDADRKLWGNLAKRGVAEKIYASVDAIADSIREAIVNKSTHPQLDIILVLNATQLVVALPSACEAFEQRHGVWLRENLRFNQVWIVAAFADNPWTYCLSNNSSRPSACV